MQSYTKIYLETLGFGMHQDVFVPCEICGRRAVDIHHILNRSHRKDLLNDINNIMALCRECHQKHGDKKQYVEYLTEVHRNYLKRFT